MFCSAKCALPADTKNVTAVTMSHGFVRRQAGFAASEGMTN